MGAVFGIQVRAPSDGKQAPGGTLAEAIRRGVGSYGQIFAGIRLRPVRDDSDENQVEGEELLF